MKALVAGWLFALLVAAPLLHAGVDFSASEPAPGNLRFTWIHGSLSAKANQDVRVQVHRYNEHTYILRQNPAVHWEAPFMYLLFGQQRAVLLDAGATQEAEYFPLRATVQRVVARWEQANQVELEEVVVMPLGASDFQIAGLGQFEGWSQARVVQPTPAARLDELGQAWPQQGQLDLGGRVLKFMPAPGLETQAIVAYDAWTQVMFSGNAIYPGRLVIRDFTAYLKTLEQLQAFAGSTPVKALWGGRIEMSADPGLDFILRANYRPNERNLPLSTDALADALGIVRLINGTTDIHIHDDFIVMHGVGRGARAYGWPVYIPEQFRKNNTR